MVKCEWEDELQKSNKSLNNRSIWTFLYNLIYFSRCDTYWINTFFYMFYAPVGIHMDWYVSVQFHLIFLLWYAPNIIFCVKDGKQRRKQRFFRCWLSSIHICPLKSAIKACFSKNQLSNIWKHRFLRSFFWI